MSVEINYCNSQYNFFKSLLINLIIPKKLLNFAIVNANVYVNCFLEGYFYSLGGAYFNTF